MGTAYAARETDADGYETTISKTTNNGAAAESDGTGRIEAAEQSDALAFANARWLYGTLTLTKQVSGTQADADKAFDFTVTLEDGAGAPLSGTVDYTVADTDGSVAPGQAVLDAQGRFTVSLKGGQTLFASKLLQGTRYAIEEADYAHDHYIVKRENAEGVIGPEPAAARFTNVKQPGSLGIAKLVGGNAATSRPPTPSPWTWRACSQAARPRNRSARSTPCATCPTAPPRPNASRSSARQLRTGTERG